MKNPYDILGVSKTASADEIKKAYRKLAKQLHPDLHPNDKKVVERFKEVSAAYTILSDKENRAKFDRGEMGADGSSSGFSGFRDAYRNYQRAGATSGGNTGAGGFGAGDFDPEDLFSSIFGNARRRQGGRAAQRGSDRIYKVGIGFLDAAKGTRRRITLENGKTLDVQIPVNVKEGQQIRLKGQGGEGLGGGPNGDALIQIEINPHDYFRLEGQDIHLDLPITLAEAILGAKVSVPTIDGNVSLSIPPGSSSGKMLRLKGKGVSSSKSKDPGDQYVKLLVMLPQTIDSDLEKFMKKWSDTNNYNVRDRFKQ